ncbi:MAG: 50S ribosomal protein L10 [Oligoflexales bacterium]
MDRQGKEKIREEVAKKFLDAKAVIVTEYRGLTVEQLTNLRVELRKASAEYKVVKNRLAKKAIDNEVKDLDGVKGKLKGPIGLILCYGDVAQATKTTLDFQKNNEIFQVKAGFSEKALLSPADLEALASLPSKDVLLAQIVGSLVAPHRNILGVLNGVARDLVRVIGAIKDKKTA